jgi:hypothetical protein
MDILKNGNGKFLLGLGLGVVGAGIAAQIVRSFDGLGRPLAKATIKSGINVYRQGHERLAQFAEYMEDLIVEARNEMENENQPASGEDIAKGA